MMATIPQAVARQHNGYYSLDTTAILAASVNAIKELKAANDRLTLANVRQGDALRRLEVQVRHLQRERMASATTIR